MRNALMQLSMYIATDIHAWADRTGLWGHDAGASPETYVIVICRPISIITPSVSAG